MTPEEFETEMDYIARMSDIETRHMEADELMCKALEELGFGRGVEIFEHISKYYV